VQGARHGTNSDTDHPSRAALQPPFTGERRDQVLAQILHKEPKAPRKINKKVPVDLESICLKALDKDPDRRYQRAGQMADDLGPVQAAFWHDAVAVVLRQTDLS
jgi:serine/threonine protein kinase